MLPSELGKLTAGMEKQSQENMGFPELLESMYRGTTIPSGPRTSTNPYKNSWGNAAAGGLLAATAPASLPLSALVGGVSAAMPTAGTDKQYRKVHGLGGDKGFLDSIKSLGSALTSPKAAVRTIWNQTLGSKSGPGNGSWYWT